MGGVSVNMNMSGGYASFLEEEIYILGYSTVEDVKLRDIVERNNLCICGSGKKFKKCCEDKMLLKGIKNYQDKLIIYDGDRASDYIYNIAEILAFKIHKDNPISLNNGLVLLQNLYDLTDGLTREFEQYFSCHKGCSSCCSVFVDVTFIEAELIRSYIDSKFTQSEQDSILFKIRENAKSAPVSISNKEDVDILDMHYRKNIPCPLLSQEGACLVYNVRPFTCRTFSVFSNPEECKPGGNSLFFSKQINNQTIKTLPILSLNVLTNLQININKNNISRHISHWFKEDFKTLMLTIPLEEAL